MPRRAPHLLLFSVAAALAAPAPIARAQILLDKLPQIENVGIVEHRGDQVPTHLVFTDTLGRAVTLGEYFDGKRPVMLVMAYYDCPLLCTLVLNRVQRALREMKWTAGEDFRVLTVSFDHTNTATMAREKQSQYLSGYARGVGDSAWPFLIGDVENIRALTSAVGYHYKFLPESGEYSHPAALIFLTPEGKVHNYIEKLDFNAGETQLALAEAAEGRIGTLFDRVVHFCFRYDPKTGQYTADAFNIMRIGATGCALGLTGLIIALARRRADTTVPITSIPSTHQEVHV